MDLIAIELLLWAALIFFFWIMKDELGNVEDAIEALGFNSQRRITSVSKRFSYDKPEQVMDAIGNYMGSQIYRYVVISGEKYQFDHIYSPNSAIQPEEDQRCLEPGLVYVRCEEFTPVNQD